MKQGITSHVCKIPQESKTKLVNYERHNIYPSSSSGFYILVILKTTFKKYTVNSTMENHRQWRITREDIAEFLEILTKYYSLYNLVIYFHLCLEVW